MVSSAPNAMTTLNVSLLRRRRTAFRQHAINTATCDGCKIKKRSVNQWIEQKHLSLVHYF